MNDHVSPKQAGLVPTTSLSTWAKGTMGSAAAQRDAYRRSYKPFIEKHTDDGNRTFVTLSHDPIYLLDGYLTESSVAFIRIRRGRLNTPP